MGLELLPESSLVESGADLVKHPLFESAIIEESPSGSGVTNARAIPDNAESILSCVFAPANDYHRARAHVLLFADDFRRTAREIQPGHA